MMYQIARYALYLMVILVFAGPNASAQSEDTFIPAKMLEGDWLAYGYQCDGPTPVQKIKITTTGALVTAIKTHGDDCVPSGHKTFEGVIISGEITGQLYVSNGPHQGPIRPIPYTLKAEGPNLITSSRATYKRVGADFTTQEREALEQLEKETADKGSISVEVLYANTLKPVEFEQIVLTRQGEDFPTGSYKFLLGGDGKWTFDTLDDGLYDITIERDGWTTKSSTSTVAVEDAGDYEVELRLVPERISVNGKLIAYNAKKKPLPVSHAKLQLRFDNGEKIDVVTDADGKYEATSQDNAKSLRLAGTFEDEGGEIQLFSDKGFGGNLVRYSSREFDTYRPDHEDINLIFLAQSDTLSPSNTAPRKQAIEAAATFYAHTMKAVKFAQDTLGLKTDHALPVEITLFVEKVRSSEGDETFTSVRYYNDTSRIIAASAKGLSSRTTVHAPDNREYHEYGHHVMADSPIGGENQFPLRDDLERNHAGVYNYRSTDSVVEGFAIFFGALVEDNSVYNMDVPYDLEENVWVITKPVLEFGTMNPVIENGVVKTRTVHDEELVVAALLWDLYDGRNEVGDYFTIPAKEIVDLLGGYTRDETVFFRTPITHVASLYNRLKNTDYGKQDSIASDKMTDLDALFVAHQFYSDDNLDGRYTEGEQIGVANFHADIFKNRIRQNVPERAYSRVRLESQGSDPKPEIAALRLVRPDGSVSDLGVQTVRDGLIGVHVPETAARVEILPILPGYEVAPIAITPDAYTSGVEQAREQSVPYFATREISVTPNGVAPPGNAEIGDIEDGVILSWTGVEKRYIVTKSPLAPPSSPDFGEIIHDGSEVWLIDEPRPFESHYRAYSIFAVNASGQLSEPLQVHIGAEPKSPRRGLGLPLWFALLGIAALLLGWRILTRTGR